MTVTGSTNVAYSGEYGFSAFAYEMGTANGHLLARGGLVELRQRRWHVHPRPQPRRLHQQRPRHQRRRIRCGNATTDGTGYAAGALITFSPPHDPGPALTPLSQPPGVRVILQLAGQALASVIPQVAVTPPTPAPLYPLTQPVDGYRRLHRPPQGIVRGIAGAALFVSVLGPPLTPLHSPVHAARPLPPAGKVISRTGCSPVRGRRSRRCVTRSLPPCGPCRHEARSSPVRAHSPALARAYPVRTPAAPVSHPRGSPGPARRAASPLPRRGTVASRSGTFSGLGPHVTPLRQPVRAVPVRLPSGRAITLRIVQVTSPVTGPPLTPLHQPVRATLPAPRQRGHYEALTGLYSGHGPALRPLTAPIRARLRPPTPPGHAFAFTYLPPTSGPAAPPLSQPRGVRVTFVRGGHVQSSPLTAPFIPASGPKLYPLHTPVRAALAAPHQHGHAESLNGAYSGEGPAVRPLTAPVRARQPLPPQGRVSRYLPGRRIAARTHPGTAVPIAPAGAGTQAPARPGPGRHDGRPHGHAHQLGPGHPAPRTAGPGHHPGALPGQPGPGHLPRRGDSAHPHHGPADPAARRSRSGLCCRSRCSRAVPSRSAPRHRRQQPQLAPLSQPPGVRVSFLRTGHVQSFRGAPPPSGPSTGPVIPPRAQPWRSPILRGIRGGIAQSRTGLFSGTGPAVRALARPVRASLPLQPVLTGRAATMAMLAVTLPAPAVTPAPPRGVPVRAVLPGTSRRGYVRSAAGTYAGEGPAVRPLAGPLRATQPLPPRGRVLGLHQGVYSGQGPALTPLHRPGRRSRCPRRDGSSGSTGPSRRYQRLRQGRRSRRGPSRCGAGCRYPGRAGPPRWRSWSSPRAPLSPHRSRPGLSLSGQSSPPQPGAGTPTAAPGHSGTGPALTLLHHPVRTLPVPSRRGQVLTTPVHAATVPVQPRSQPWRAVFPAQPRPGYIRSSHVTAGQTPGPAPLRTPVRARQPQPLRGQVLGVTRTVAVPPVPITGPPVYPLRQPVRARQPLPPRGRVLGVYQVVVLPPTPTIGPRIPPRAQPWRAVLPAPAPARRSEHVCPAAPANGTARRLSCSVPRTSNGSGPLAVPASSGCPRQGNWAGRPDPAATSHRPGG